MTGQASHKRKQQFQLINQQDNGGRTVKKIYWLVYDNERLNETTYLKRLRFTHLPEKCTISIFTISGERVITLDHDVSLDSGISDDVDGGNHWWNLRTMNNQEVAPGLYIYVVEGENRSDKCIGKFAIVR